MGSAPGSVMVCWSCWTDCGSRKAWSANWPRAMISSGYRGMGCARGSTTACCRPRPGCWAEAVAPTLGYNIAEGSEAGSVKENRNPGCRMTGYMRRRGSSKEPQTTESPRFAGRELKKSARRAQGRKARKMAGRAVQLGGTGMVIVDGLGSSSRRPRYRTRVDTGRLV